MYLYPDPNYDVDFGILKSFIRFKFYSMRHNNFRRPGEEDGRYTTTSQMLLNPDPFPTPESKDDPEALEYHISHDDSTGWILAGFRV